MEMHTPLTLLVFILLPQFTQALNYNWKKSTAEENNFLAKDNAGMSYESGELFDIQKSSIKLLYAQLSKTKAFLYSLAPEVVERGIQKKTKKANEKLKFFLFIRCIVFMISKPGMFNLKSKAFEGVFWLKASLNRLTRAYRLLFTNRIKISAFCSDTTYLKKKLRTRRRAWKKTTPWTCRALLFCNIQSGLGRHSAKKQFETSCFFSTCVKGMMCMKGWYHVVKHNLRKTTTKLSPQRY